MTTRLHTAQTFSSLSARGLRIPIIASRFNETITELLVRGAVDCLQAHDGEASVDDVLWVPGAFELPLAADEVAASRRCDGVICLGAVIRGETPHFEYVSAECARGIQDVMLRRRLPVAFGVLTTDNLRQARVRAGGAAGNKGWDAALTAIEMASFIRQVRKQRRSGRRK